MMKRFFVFLALVLGFSQLPLAAQKECRNVKSILKKGSAGDALKEVERLLATPEFESDPRVMDYGVRACKKMLDVENEKNYLKQAYDTVGTFNHTYNLISYILRCDDLKQAEKNEKRRSRHQNLLKRYFPNLRAAGNYHYAKKNYEEVVRFFDFMLEVPEAPVAKGVVALSPSEKSSAAYLCLLSMYAMNSAEGIRKYSEMALSDSAGRRNVRVLSAASSLSLKDEVAYESILRQGLREFPRDPYFFTHLSDFYMQKQRFEDANALGDEMLQKIDAGNPLYLVSKSTALMNLKRYEEAIEFGKRALAVDKNNAVMNYVVGACYCNLALNVELPSTINSAKHKERVEKQKGYYSLAQPYLETYRMLSPEDSEKWAPLLYRVYLSLNLGKKFDEIEHFLN